MSAEQAKEYGLIDEIIHKHRDGALQGSKGLSSSRARS